VKKRWKSILAGILSIISAPFVLTLSLGGALQGHTLMGQLVFWCFAALAIVAIVGGVFAIRGRVWGLAFAGSICATISLFTWYLGIVAIILIILSKNEFK